MAHQIISYRANRAIEKLETSVLAADMTSLGLTDDYEGVGRLDIVLTFMSWLDSSARVLGADEGLDILGKEGCYADHEHSHAILVLCAAWEARRDDVVEMRRRVSSLMLEAGADDDSDDVLTLASVIEHYGAAGFVFADEGNGSSFGEKGRFVFWDEEAKAAYGHIMMNEVEEDYSEDGVEVGHESDWIECADGYRFKVRF